MLGWSPLDAGFVAFSWVWTGAVLAETSPSSLGGVGKWNVICCCSDVSCWDAWPFSQVAISPNADFSVAVEFSPSVGLQTTLVSDLDETEEVVSTLTCCWVVGKLKSYKPRCLFVHEWLVPPNWWWAVGKWGWNTPFLAPWNRESPELAAGEPACEWTWWCSLRAGENKKWIRY